jgi:hypothetical protein
MRRLFKINLKYKGLKRESLSTTMDFCHLFEDGLEITKKAFFILNINRRRSFEQFCALTYNKSIVLRLRAGLQEPTQPIIITDLQIIISTRSLLILKYNMSRSNRQNNDGKQTDQKPNGPRQNNAQAQNNQRKNQNNTGGGGKKLPNRPCRHCGRNNHAEKDCYTLKDSNGQRQYNTNGGEKKKPSKPCFHCQGDHWSKDCPNKGNSQPKNGFQNGNQQYNVQNLHQEEIYIAKTEHPPRRPCYECRSHWHYNAECKRPGFDPRKDGPPRSSGPQIHANPRIQQDGTNLPTFKPGAMLYDNLEDAENYDYYDREQFQQPEINLESFHTHDSWHRGLNVDKDGDVVMNEVNSCSNCEQHPAYQQQGPPQVAVPWQQLFQRVAPQQEHQRMAPVQFPFEQLIYNPKISFANWRY